MPILYGNFVEDLQINVLFLTPKEDTELESLNETLVDFISVSLAMQRVNIDLAVYAYFLMRLLKRF